MSWTAQTGLEQAFGHQITGSWCSFQIYQPTNVKDNFKDEEEQSISSEEDSKVKASASKASKKMQWPQAMEELKKDFENQIRGVEKKLGREMREMQENHEKRINSLLKGTPKMMKKITPLKIV